jgi:hypothetical protein
MSLWAWSGLSWTMMFGGNVEALRINQRFAIRV